MQVLSSLFGRTAPAIPGHVKIITTGSLWQFTITLKHTYPKTWAIADSIKANELLELFLWKPPEDAVREKVRRNGIHV